MDKKNYPRIITGDPVEDDFATANPFIKLYPQYKQLVEEHGDEMASKIFWCLYILYDNTSFYFTRKTYSDRLRFITSEYWKDFDIIKYQYLKKFYEDEILINKKMLHYNKLVQIYEGNLESGKYKVTDAVKDRQTLTELEDEINNIIEESFVFKIAGNQQPGIMAATIKKSEGG